MAIRLMTLTLNTVSAASLVEFYKALGAQLQAVKVSKGSEVYKGTVCGIELAVYSVAKKNSNQTPQISLRFEVDKIDQVMEKVRKLSDIQILMDVESLPDGKKAIVLDPEGHSIEIVESWAEA